VRSISVDALLDQAVAAMNRGEHETARELAGVVLATDSANRDAYALLAESAASGEMRRASLLFVDLVGSTELSERHEPELYRSVISRYKAVCRRVIRQRYGGHVSHIAGDGLLAAFGIPTPHEDDAERAVMAALDIAAELEELSAEVEAAVGERLAARSGVHKGIVYVDLDDNEVYGLAANVTARLHSLAAPGTVVISEEMRDIVGDLFETVVEPAQRVKGVTNPLRPVRVIRRRPEPAPRQRRPTGPVVGRAREQAALRQAFDDVRSTGARVCVHLVGEPGVGKSRLCSWLVGDVTSASDGCLELRGSPLHADAALHPIRQFIDERLSDDRPAADRLGRLDADVLQLGLDADEMVPLLAAIAGIQVGDAFAVPQAEGRKLHEAVVDASARYLLACLGSGTAVLVAEDLHWFDTSTLDVLGRLARAGNGVLLLTTSRDPVPRELRESRVLRVEPLDHETSRQLVRLLDPSIAMDTCDEIVSRADGVPLFVEHLVHGAGTTASPTVATAGAAEAPGPVPDVLYEPLVSRLYATPTAVPVAAAAATIGRDVDRRLLSRILEMAESDLTVALVDLLGALILDRAAGQERYRFRHELLREVAYGLQPPSRRRALHARLADALVEQSDDSAVDWRVVARHYQDAGRPLDAVTAYQHAADAAQRLGALAQARGLLETGIDLVADVADPQASMRCEVGLRLRRGFLAVAAEGNSSRDAASDYERCLELTISDPTSDEMFGTLIALWGHYVMRGDLARAEQVVDLLHSNLQGERALYAPENEAASGVLRWYQGDFVPARARLESAVTALGTRGSGDLYEKTWFLPTDGWASCQVFLALAREVRGDAPGADEQVRAALRRCSEIEFPHGPTTAATVHLYNGWILMERGELAAAERAIDEVHALAERHGFDIMALASALQRATVAGLAELASDGDAAGLTLRGQVLDGLIDMWRALDIAVFAPFYIGVSARLRACAGDHDSARARVDEALALAATTGMHFYDAELARIRANSDPGGDRPIDDQLVAAREIARAQGATIFERRIASDLQRLASA
jgi:class 3 adenylate cyclase/tetratricopeptide (TPR) repeat protein